MIQDQKKKLIYLNRLLPLVAIGTVADCQSILEPTNRLLVRAGLKMLNDKSDNIAGLGAMLEFLGFNDKINQGYRLSSQDLGFVLSPILNSSGRLSHAKLSIGVMLGDGGQENLDQISALVQTNNDRKKMVKDILEDIENQAEEQYIAGNPVLWLEGDWSKGIVGLLASRLVNTYDLPVVVVSVEQGHEQASASLRAPEGYHLPNAISDCGELIQKGGGHPGAAGFSADISNLPQIRSAMSASLQSQLTSEQQEKEIYTPDWVDISSFESKTINRLQTQKNLIWLKKDQLTSQLLQEILNLDPYGQDFPMPALMVQLGTTDFSFKFLGNDQKHVKFNLPNGLTITAFNIKDDLKSTLLKSTDSQFWCTLKVSQNTWRDKTTLELIAENIWI
jgi:single-stranded-DNA-specific exonuclease